MSTLSSITSSQQDSSDAKQQSDEGFLKFLPAVRTHAGIQFRHLSKLDREEAMAEADAGAFINYKSAERRGKNHRLRPSTVATFAVLGVKDGRRCGGGRESRKDALSPWAQRAGGFQTVPLPAFEDSSFDCLRAPDQPVWKDRLLHDCRTLPSDQAAFRIDWSDFMAGQSDRSRTLIAMLAAGRKQVEVADHLGVTPPSICRRRKKALREWEVFQGEIEGIDSDGVAGPQTASNRISKR